MLLHIVARGRIGRGPEAELVDRYVKRLAWPVRLTELPDAGDVIVHLFRPEVRSFYNLERMWAFGDEAAATASPSNPPVDGTPPTAPDAPDAPEA